MGKITLKALMMISLAGLLLLQFSHALAQSPAPVLKQPVLLGKQALTLESILEQLEKKAGCSFSYNPELLPLKKEISLDGKEKTVAQVLNAALARTGLEYVERGGVIIIRKNNRHKHTISGYLRDKESAENLIGANIFNTNTHSGTSSNNYGFYSITVPSDTASFLISYVGYQPVLLELILSGDTAINISLEKNSLLKEVIVTSERSEAIHESERMSVVSLPVAQLKSMPAFMGEADVLKAVQLMPGVHSGNEGNGGLYVRGGGPDQNLILMDGVPVYNATHLLGFFSIFNVDAINNIELIKGGFPARYGGRLSSVLDINMKEGNMKSFHGEGSVGILSSKLSLEGPLVKDKASFIISGRRTYLDLWMKPLVQASSDGLVSFGYYFYDLNTKLNYKLSDRDRLYFSSYFGSDAANVRFQLDSADYQLRVRSGLSWGNNVTAFRWNRAISNKLFSNLSFTYSKYKLGVGTEVQESGLPAENYEGRDVRNVFNSGINDLTLKADFDFFPQAAHHVRWGVAAIHHTFNPGVYHYQAQEADTARGLKKVYGWEYNTYVEDDIRVSNRFRINAGLHFSGFRVKQRNYLSLQPRLTTRYLLTEKLSFKASIASMTQFIHLLSTSGIGMPSDLWVPSTENIRPQQSHQAAAGIARTLGRKYEFSAEGYYKIMSGLIEYKEGSSYLYLDKSWQDKVATGQGESYGAEFLLQKKYGKTTGWFGYTLSWAYRQFDELNNGRPFPYRYDRRHDISLAVMHRIKKNIELSSTWVYGTGNAITLPQAFYRSMPNYPGAAQNQPIYYYAGRNDFRMAPYHRLDLSAGFHKKKKWGERTWTVGVYNAYNRKNPFFIDRISGPVGGKFIQFSLFPIIPSVSYSFKF
jgi:hypothetical protein